MVWGFYLVGDDEQLAWGTVADLGVVVLLGLIMAARWIGVYRAYAAPDSSPSTVITVPPERHFPRSVVAIHGILAATILVLVVLSVLFDGSADAAKLPAGMACPGGVATSAQVFVSNALGGNTSTSSGTPVTGNCTVVRIDFDLGSAALPKLTSTTVVGSGYPGRADKAAVILAPTGLALGHNGTLYVVDTQSNTISAIPQATTRTTAQAATAGLLSAGGALDAPLGMTLAPNGDLIVVNGNNGNAVEITPAGHQLTTKTLVKNGAGDLFGIITTPDGIVAVNDGANALERFHSSSAPAVGRVRPAHSSLLARSSRGRLSRSHVGFLAAVPQVTQPGPLALPGAAVP